MLWMIAVALAAPLTLDGVLESVDARVPTIAAAEAEVAAAEARVHSARGSFDPYVGAKAASYWSKDPRQVVDLSTSGDTVIGMDWSVGYRYGGGSFPGYAGDDLTGDRGEVYARVALPLLDGLWLGEDRVALQAAMQGVEGQQAERRAVEVGVRLRAASSYWKWVKAGAALEVEQGLLALAESRASVLRREVEEGLRAELHLLDNERVLLERRGAAEAAKAALSAASLSLSLYVRDADGTPRAPSVDRLPSLGPSERADVLEEDLARLEQRPDVEALRRWVAVTQTQRRGARNSLLPSLSLSVEHAQPLTADKSETIVGVSIGSSLLARSDRGKIRGLDAKRDVLMAKVRSLLDQADADVRAVHARLEAIRQQVGWLGEAMQRADQVRVMETRRFELGASDLLAVLLREEALAKSQKQYIQAIYVSRLLEAELDAMVAR